MRENIPDKHLQQRHTTQTFKNILHNWFFLKQKYSKISTHFWFMIVFPFCSSFYRKRSQTFPHCFFCRKAVFFPDMNQNQHSNQDHPQKNPHTCTACMYSSGSITRTYFALLSYNTAIIKMKSRKHLLIYKTLDIPHYILKVQGKSNQK